MKLSRRFTLTMATVALVLYAAKSSRSDELQIPEQPLLEPQPQTTLQQAPQIYEEWRMEIQPAVKLQAVPSLPVEVHTATGDANGAMTFDRATYTQIYNSIPFSRAEYDVNPNYRHDSTMEILTGNPRHQTIVRHDFEHKQPVRRIPAPTRPSRILTPFSTSGLLFGGPFGYGFGYGPGRWGY